MNYAGQYPMAVKINGTTNGTQNYRGVLYNITGTTSLTITPIAWSATSTEGYREPAYLTHTDFADGSSSNNVTPKIAKELLQEEFNRMVEKVSQNKGFWVGRYETSNMNSSADNDLTQKIASVKGTTVGIGNVNWYRMYAEQKNYSKLALASNSTLISSMIWGSQWDQIMIWMKEVENERVTTYGKYFVTNSVGYGNLGNISGAESYDTATATDAPAATGSSEYFKVKNIYDLAGNLLDWTIEAYNTSSRVTRGGDYITTWSYYTQASHRSSNVPNISDTGYGSRVSLY